MAPNSPKRRTKVSQTRKGAGASSEESDEVVKTFSFDVSAGAVVAAGEKKDKVAKPASIDETCASMLDECATTELEVAQPILIGQAKTARGLNSYQRKKTPTTGRRRVPSWLSSVVVHTVLLLLLSLYALPVSQKKQDFDLAVSAALIENLDVDEFHEIDMELPEEMDSSEAELAAELSDPDAAALGLLAVESALSNEMGDTPLVADSLGDMGTLFGENGNGLSDLSTDTSSGNTASFFGARVEGKRILYMLDNSGSMTGGRMETMIAELLKSVDQLHPRQQFYVLFYSDTVYGLGHPQPINNFVPADKKNKQQLRQWLETVELCGGNAVDKAIVAAEAIQPDVVFMLSDGRVRTTRSGRKYQLLLNSAGRRFTLHTLGMGCKTTEHRAQLLAIAEAHGGTFREVEVQPRMAELSRRQPLVYRNSGNGGGDVWGTSFDKVGTKAQ